MSEVKHTAGPWRTFNMFDVFPDDDDTLATRHIADCDMSENLSIEEKVANAKLFAAAPELLEVVRAMATFDGRNNNKHLKDMAIAAIAKAEGRS